MAYAAVGRSASGSSGDFSSDGHDNGRQSPAALHAFTDKTIADSTASSESKAMNRGFFDTLEWQAAGVPTAARETDHKKTDRVQQMEAFEIASTSLDEEFADFSAHRISANPNAAEGLSKVDESEHIHEGGNADTATADLLGASAWNDDKTENNLFDVGPPEPTNFDLLVGPTTLGNTNGNSSSGVDLLNNDPPFVADFRTCAESSNNPFDVQDACTVSDNSTLNDMAANLFGMFDPCLTSASADEKPVSSSNEPSRVDGQTGDFVTYMESESAARSGKDDGPDLMGGWTTSNIFSGVTVNMPRASSQRDFGSGTSAVQSDVPRASSSQNMSSKSFGTANGSARSTKAADPFANIG